MVKVISVFVVFLIGLVGMTQAKTLYGEPDDGGKRTPFTLSVGSQAAASPFDQLGGEFSVSTFTIRLNKFLIVNSTPYELYLGTTSAFETSGNSFFINNGSSTYSDSNKAKPYFRLPPTASSTTVRGCIYWE